MSSQNKTFDNGNVPCDLMFCDVTQRILPYVAFQQKNSEDHF